ncbi:hypothetical protein Patl1_27116 [Pistacia atlantica]|uniref:Uncharacterized protein n=1 Tax=Pistacia atlantica TaxID=434234 RepID=A0ACC1B4R1_9ROSI|nr:hypothetical protein Patl1_27116 [Pistacia atlantica]
MMRGGRHGPQQAKLRRPQRRNSLK